MDERHDILRRRDVLRLAAGGALWLAGGGTALAARPRPVRPAAPKLPDLIAKARAIPGISARIASISQGLLGARYRANTLIGTAAASEVLVTRDDSFDCVTFCETVLAAALARTPEEFAPMLRQVRYHDGIVTWFARNHYYHEWSERNVANHICRGVELPGMATIEKTVTWHRELGSRRFVMHVIPARSFLENQAMLATGDIVGFVTKRPNLDYFHTGFVVFGPGGKSKGAFLLRHAAQSRRRVLDEPMARFMRANRVRYVSVLRPLDPPAGTATSKI